MTNRDDEFWAPYAAVVDRYPHDLRLIAREGRHAAVFAMPGDSGCPDVPTGRLWHNLKSQFVALDATGIARPLRVLRGMHPEVPAATILQELSDGIRFRLLTPALDLNTSLAGQEHAIRHALMQVMSVRRWWRANLAHWQRWRAFSGGPPALDARRIPPHHTWALRQKILRPSQDIREMAWDGDTEETSIHGGGYADGVLAAVATLLKRDYPADGTRPGLRPAPPGVAFQLRGMATDDAVRGGGLGKGLLHWCFDRARDAGADALWCNARTSAAGFYTRHGMEVVSDEFEIPDVGPHVVMMTILRRA